MEYTFKLSPQQAPTKINLGEYSLTLRKGDEEQKIAYANVISVRIDMAVHAAYKIHLDVDGYGHVIIPSWTFGRQGKKEYQSSAYSLFVRVLHHHLKDKSQAIFKSGKDASRIWLWAGIGAGLSWMISFVLNYLGFGLMNPYVQSLIFSAAAVILIFVFSIKKLPKTYNPSEIPLQFLP